MMHIKPNKGVVADVSDFTGTISTKERGFISLTKIVVTSINTSVNTYDCT